MPSQNGASQVLDKGTEDSFVNFSGEKIFVNDNLAFSYLKILLLKEMFRFRHDPEKTKDHWRVYDFIPPFRFSLWIVSILTGR